MKIPTVDMIGGAYNNEGEALEFANSVAGPAVVVRVFLKNAVRPVGYIVVTRETANNWLEACHVERN